MVKVSGVSDVVRDVEFNHDRVALLVLDHVMISVMCIDLNGDTCIIEQDGRYEDVAKEKKRGDVEAVLCARVKQDHRSARVKGGGSS